MKVKECYIFTNGMVAAFDEEGNQITECQGFILDVANKLKTYCDKDTKWGFCKWRGWAQEADFSWWWEQKEEKCLR